MSMTKIQKELLGALIGLARSVDGRGEAAKGESQEFSSGDSNGHRPDKATHEILLGGICAANPEKELREEDGKSWIVRVEAEKNRLNPDCAVCKGKCGRTDNYDLEEMETDEPSDRARKEQILAELFPMAEKLQQLRKETKEQNKELQGAVNFLYKALFAIGNYVGEKSLQSVVQEMNTLFVELENVLKLVENKKNPLSGVYKKPRKQGIFCVLRQVHKTYYRVFTKFCKSRQNCRQALATEK